MIEPRQPEGELAGCPHLESSIKGCIHTGEPCSGDECLFTEGSQAQRAQDKATMVPISKLRAIIQEASNEPRYFIAVENKLRKLLKEQKP